MQGHQLLSMVTDRVHGTMVLLSLPFPESFQANLVVPLVSLLLLTISLRPLAIAWLDTRFSPLRPAVNWAILSAAFGIASQILAFTEPLTGGRPATGLLCYLGMAASLAALTSVLGARRPGVGAWVLLMIMLFGVLLLPLMEASLFTSQTLRVERLRLDAPWSLFVAVVMVTGVSNYLFTRWNLSAMLLGAGLLVEYVAMISPEWSAERRGLAWSIGPGLSGLAMIVTMLGHSRSVSRSDLETRWMWFRDRWGVVWALRVRERFNQTAERSGWPVRLSWHGLRATSGEPCSQADLPEEAASTFELLIRRFRSTL